MEFLGTSEVIRRQFSARLLGKKIKFKHPVKKRHGKKALRKHAKNSEVNLYFFVDLLNFL